MLSMHEDFYNFVDYFNEYWNDHLLKLEEQIVGESGTQLLDAESQKLSSTIEFYSMFFDMDNMMQKLETGEAENEKFLEYVCKFIQRIIDLGSDPQQVYNQFKHLELSISEELAAGGKKAAKKATKKKTTTKKPAKKAKAAKTAKALPPKPVDQD